MKRVMTMLLCFVLVFTSLFSHVPYIISAEEVAESESIEEVYEQQQELPESETADTEPAETQEEDPDGWLEGIEIVYRSSESQDNDELLKGYINTLLYGQLEKMSEDPVNLFDSYEIQSKKQTGRNLKKANKVFYNELMDQINEVADGQRESTVLTISSESLEKTNWTADELGVDTITSENAALVYDMIGFDLDELIDALLFDNPYAFYWYDKTIGVRTSIPSVSYSSSYASISGDFSFYFTVASEFAGDEDYTIDTSIVDSINTSINNAQEIVDKYANSTDLEKLYGYKNEICELVSYNYDAVNNNVAYGNPWQLIWVFDEDDSTNVVCEGYSKAFQYLCDLTDFDHDEFCAYSVSGYMNGGTGAGAHMWNILHMDDHNNYLVDVTNCDSGTIGADEKLFIVGADENGSVESGYTFTVGSTPVSYTYDADTKKMFSVDELTITNGTYEGPAAEEESSAYAILDNGELKFFRSIEEYTNGSEYTIDIGNDQYTGTVIAGFEDIEEIVFASNSPFYAYRQEITSVSIPSTVTISPLTTRYWFTGCTNLTSVDLSGLDTSKVSEMTGMFQSCSSLESLDLRSFNTANVIAMGSLFSGCSNLVTLDLSSFDTSSVSYMANMFNNTSSLHEVVLGEYFTNWTSDAKLPEGTWANGSYSMDETQLQENYGDNAVAWAGTWIKQDEPAIKTVPELMIVSEEGNVIISGDKDDQDYIGFIEDQVSNENDRLYIVDPELSSSTCFAIYELVNNGDALVDDDHRIVIYQDLLIRYGIVNGVKNFEFVTEGYEDHTVEGVELLNVCQAAPDVTVGFDSDHNLLLYCDDPDWIQSYDNQYSYLSIRTTDYNDGWYFGLTDIGAYANDDYIVIPKDSLISHQIPDDYYHLEVRLYGYGSSVIENVYLSGYGEQFDIRVNQLENGDVHIYSNVDGLIDICKDQEMEVEVLNAKGDYYIGNGHDTDYREMYSNLYYSIETDDDEKEYILLSNDDLMAKHVASGESTIYINGYSSNTINLVACKEVPEGLRAYEDGDELIISGDHEFLQALLARTSRAWGSGNKLIAEYGSHVQFSSGDLIGNKDDSEMGTVFDSISPIVYDEALDVLKISANILQGNYVMNDENTSVNLEANGYETTTIEVEGGITIGCNDEAVYFNIEQNDDGDIIITSENDAWLRNLTVVAERNNAGNSVYGSSMFLSQNDGSSSLSLKNEIYNPAILSNPMVTTSFYYDTDEDGKGYVYVPFEYIKKQGLDEGTIFDSFYVNVLGFTYTDTADMTLTIIKSSDPAPELIEAEELDNGDIKVTASDLAWLEKVATPLLAPNRYNYVLIKPESKSYGFTFSNYLNSSSDALIFNGEYLLIDHKAIRSSQITNGQAEMTFYAEGYKTSDPIEITLAHACSYAPEDVIVTADEYGGLIVSSSDTNWIETMVFGNEEESSYIRRRIMVFDGDGNYAGDLYSGCCDYDFVIGDDHTSFTIPNKMVRDRGISEGVYDLEFYTYGYESTRKESVTINEYVDREVEEIIESTSASQSSESLDLQITSEYSTWLQELAEVLNTGRYMYFDTGSVPFSDDFISFEYEDDVPVGFTISYEALLESHVAVGDLCVTFPATENYPSIMISLADVVSEACQTPPSGLKALETEEGIRLYFDDPGEDELAFLRALLKESQFENNTGKTIHKGSGINVYSEDYSMSYYFDNWINIDPDTGETLGGNSRLLLSEDETYVYIPSEIILRESTLYNTEDTIRFNVEAYGYTRPDYTIEIQGLKYAKQALSDDFSIDVSLDEDMNLIIRSSDQDWLEALGKFTIYDEYEQISEYGSHFAMIRAEEWKYIYFGHDHHTGYNNASENSYELLTDEDSGEKYIFVSRDNLIERFGDVGEIDVVGKKYYFDFSTYGYQNYQSSPEIEGEYVEFSEELVRSVPALLVSENENGDIVIEAEDVDDDYLAYLDSFLNGEKNYLGVDQENSMYVFYPPVAYGYSDFKVEDNKIILENATIIDRNIINGTHTVRIKTVGYVEFAQDVTLTKACKKSPDNITVQVNEDKDLEILSEDTDWLSAMAQGEIQFHSDSYWGYAKKDTMILKEDRVVIGKDRLVELSLPDGDYTITLYPYAYGSLSKTLSLSGYIKDLEAEVSVNGETGDLIITCDDTDFLNALAATNVYELRDNVYYRTHVGGRVELRYYDNGIYSLSNSADYNGEKITYEEYPLELNGNRIVINNFYLLNRTSVPDCDDMTVVLQAPGYEKITISGVVLSGVRDPFVPDDVEITLEENGDLVIDSEYKEWLQAICVPDDDWSDNYITGGFLTFMGDKYVYSVFNHDDEETLMMSYIESEGVVRVFNYGMKYYGLPNGECNLYIHPYKYAQLDYGDITITGGVKEVPENIEISVNNSDDILITSSDPDYLESFISSDQSHVSLFGNDVEYYIAYDRFTLDGDTLVISSDVLAELEVDEGEYTIVLDPFDYVILSQAITLPSYNTQVTEPVSVTALDGSLLIVCNDTDFLNALTTQRIVDGEDVTQKGGIIEVVYDDETVIHIINSYYVQTENTFTYFEVNGNKIQVDNNTMLMLGIMNAQAATINLYAPGYRKVTISDVEIRNAINPDTPDNVKVSVEENGDLVITSDDTAWLQAICEPSVHEDTPIMPGGRIVLSPAEGDGRMLTNTDEEEIYYYDNGKVILPVDKQIELKLYEGTYHLTILPYKYQIFMVDEELVLSEAYHKEPTDVQIELLNSGIVISSNDGRWKNVLRNDARTVIKLKNDDHEYLFDGEDLKVDGDQLILSMSTIRQAKVVGGTYTLYLYPYGYDGSYKSKIVIVDPADLEPTIKVAYAGADVLPVATDIEFEAVIQAADDYIAKWNWDFGDETSEEGKSVLHAYEEVGEYEISLRVTDIYGDSYETSRTVSVVDPEADESQYTIVDFSVLDSEDATVIENATIIINSQDDDESYELLSDEDGNAQAILKNGSYIVTGVAKDHMARTFEMTVEGGHRDQLISLYATSIMSGEITVKEMSREEIIEAGINPDAPGNQQVFEFVTTFTFNAGLAEYEVSYPTYRNGDGEDVGPAKDPIHIAVGSSGGGHSSGGGSHDDEDKAGKTIVTVYPISEKFAMVVYGEAHWLKEMFQVALVVNNDSSVESLKETTAVLQLPEGVSLAEMINEPQSMTSNMGTIAPKGSANTIWYVRGDSEGDYFIGAHVSAKDMYNALIEEEFETTEAIHVYAGSALHLSIILDDVATRGEDYIVRYRLENVSNRSIYNLSFGITGSEQFKVVGYTDQSKQYKEITGEDFGDSFVTYVEELAPNGYIEMNLATTIWFKSQLEYLRFIPKLGDFIDISYYAENISLTQLSESTTSIPYDIYVNRTERETWINHVMDVIAEKYISDLIPQTPGDFIVEVVGETLGLPSWLVDAAETELKLQQGTTEYTMRITIDDGVEGHDYIENDIIRIRSGNEYNYMIDFLNDEFYSINTKDAIIEAKMPGTTTVKIAILDPEGEIFREYTQDVVIEKEEIYDLIAVPYDSSSNTYVVPKTTMSESAEKVKGEVIDALLINPFQSIPTYVEYEVDDGNASDGYTASFFNDDKSGGGALYSETHEDIYVNGYAARMDFSREAWSQIAKASEDEFSISAWKLSEEELSELGKEDEHILKFTVASGDEAITSFDESIEITVPYEINDPDVDGKVYIEHIKGDGRRQVLAAEYDEQDQTATFNTEDLSGYFIVCEGEPEADTLTLDQETMSLFVGDRKKLAVMEGIKVGWSSDNEEVATVDEDGMVIAESKGVAIITATSIRHPDLSASCAVSVAEPIDPYGDILPEDRPADPSLIPAGFWTSELIYDAEDPFKEIRYTGSPITLSFRVYDYNRLLLEGIDYTVKYSNNTKAGTASITITGKGNYTGSLVKTFEILPAKFNDEDTIVILDKDVFIENGKNQKPSVSVVHNGVSLKSKTDYILSYELDGKTSEPGEYTLSITGNGNYEGVINKVYTIYDKDSFIPVSALKVTGIKSYPYTGEEIEQEDIKVLYGKEELVRDVDYTLTYVDNIDTGTAYVVIEGTMNMDTDEGQYSYAGTLTKSFKITQLTLSSKVTEVEGLEEETDFTGEEIKQELLVIHNERVLEEDVDYTLTYKNNIKAGTAAVTIKGMGNYKGSLSKTYKILKVEISSSDIDMNDTYDYTKGGVKPEPAIVVNGRELIANTDYTLTYKNNTKLGTATMTVKGKGSYLGTITKSFEIVERDIGEVNMTVADKVYSAKANGWKSTPVLTDVNGKKLAAGTDYSKTMSYTYVEDTIVIDGSDKAKPEVLRSAGDEVLKNDILPVNTMIEVTVNTEGLKTNNFVGEISEIYRIVAGDVSKATVTVPAQFYTGDPIEPNEDEITVKLGKIYLPSSDFEIESYENNINKGTAYVTIRGIGDYGGTKRVKFTIKQKTMAQTIHFNPNGATSGTMKDMTISKDTRLTKNAFKKTGYTFKGWSTTPDGSVEYENNQLFTYDPMKAGTITTLYAVWE